MPMIEPGWQRRSKCQDLGDVDLPLEDQKPGVRTLADQLFFVGQGGKSGNARRYCADCPVRRSCLNYGVLYDMDGFWAGTSKEERNLYPPEFQEALREEAIYHGTLENHDIEPYIEALKSQVTDVEVQEGVDIGIEKNLIVNKDFVVDSTRDTIDNARQFLSGFESILEGVLV